MFCDLDNFCGRPMVGNPLWLLEKECHTLDVSCGESATSGVGVDKDDFFSPPIEVQRWINDSKADLNELARFLQGSYPRFLNAKRMFIRLNMGIPSSAPAEHLFSKGYDIFSIKRGMLSDDIFEMQ